MTYSYKNMDYPDINKREEIVWAIANLNVLGGMSRSFTLDEEGEPEPDRYIEQIGTYCSDHNIRTAVDVMFDNPHCINGLDGMIISQSRDELIIQYADGTKRTFVAKDE